MTRKEAEEKIGKLLLEIRDIYHEYNPDGKQLNIGVTDKGHWAFNAYWAEDKKHPMDFYIMEGAE